MAERGRLVPRQAGTLAEQLKPRIVRERQFKLTGRKLRRKSWLFRHEKRWLRPMLKWALQTTGIYKRGVKNALSPVVRRLTFVYPNLPPAFDGYRILHLSDLHIDGVPGLEHALGSMLSNVKADVCLLTGDYRFDDEGTCENIYPPLQELLRSIQTPDGIVSILGNHDAAEIAFELERMNVRMLVNEAIPLERSGEKIWVVGVDDPFDYQTDNLPDALSQVPPNAFTVLLAHTPQLYSEAANAGIDLYLTGHTHAGQIRFPIVGALRHNCPCPKIYSFGHWTCSKEQGLMHGYTTAGAGCSSLPIRYGCPPEAALIELRCEPK